MAREVNNITETICGRLQFLQLHEVFMYFLRLTISRCNILTYNKIGDKIRFKKKFTKNYRQNILFT
jgi:hypothetical protein